MTLEILHVDDDDNIRDLVRLSFDLAGGARVHSAASGREALTMVDGGLTPDVVLLDVMMPGFDGPDTLRALADRPGMLTVPVYFMTAQVMTEELDRLHALGAAGVVTKPFDPMTLPGDIFERVRTRSR